MLPGHDHEKCLQMLANVPWGEDSLMVENHYFVESEATSFVHSAIGKGQNPPTFTCIHGKTPT